MVEDKEEDRGRTLPSGAPVGFSPKVETARVSDRDRKMNRRTTRERREGENTERDRRTDTNIDRDKDRDGQKRRGGW